MKTLVALVMAAMIMAAGAPLTAASEPVPGKDAETPAATSPGAEKPGDAAPEGEKVAPDEKLPALEGLIETAEAKMAEAGDLVADLVMGGKGRAGTGSLRILMPDRMKFVAEFKEKDADGKERIAGTIRMVRGKDVLYIEESGKEAAARKVTRIDMGQLEALRKEKAAKSPLVAPLLDEIKAPKYESYLREARAAGTEFKVLKVDGDLVTLEGTRTKKLPLPGKRIARTVCVVSLADGFPRAIRDYAEDGELLGLVEFSKIRFSTGLKAEEFEYRPPDNVPVIDLVEMLRAMLAMSQLQQQEDK